MRHLTIRIVACAFLSIVSVSSIAQTQISNSHSHLRDTQNANQTILSWFHDQEAGKRDWLSQRGKPGGPPNAIDFVLIDKPARLRIPSLQEAAIAKATKELYDSYFPPNDVSSYIGTWIESGHPYIETEKYGPYQWNSHWGSGIDRLDAFRAAIRQLVALGIKNIRIGPNLHEIDPKSETTWDPFLDKIQTIWEYGATPTISVTFFSSLTRWAVKGVNGEIDYEKSHLLNPQWPSDMRSDTKIMMTRLLQRARSFRGGPKGFRPRVVINPVNEPETFAGFNRNFWHGAHAPWGSAEMMKFYVPSLIHIAQADVLIRLGVEEASGGERILFMHNEAMTPPYYPSHNGYGRFALSKFMLGDQLLLQTDFSRYEVEPLSQMKLRLERAFNEKVILKSASVNEIDWAFKEFVFGEFNKSNQDREVARTKLVSLFRDLQRTHALLYKKTGKTMKTDNFLDLDYYCQGEFLLPLTVTQIVERLSDHNGELLKKVLGVKDDIAFMTALEESAQEAECELNGRGSSSESTNDSSGEKCLLGVDLSPSKNRFGTDFKNFLSKEDHAVLYNLIGLRSNFEKLEHPDLVARQEAIGMDQLTEEFRRSDLFMRSLLDNEASGLRKILKVENDEDMVRALKTVARDTRDGGPEINLSTDGLTLRQILNSHNRLILHRLLGLKRSVGLGFEPQHYGRQVRMGLRQGFYKTAVEYVNALRVFTIGVGESGTPFYVFAPLLHDQMMLDYSKVLEGGVYGTHYSFGPAVDTIGWGKGPLSKHFKEDHIMEPTGIFRVLEERGDDGLPFTRLTRWRDGDPWVQTFLHHPQFGFFHNLKRFMPKE